MTEDQIKEYVDLKNSMVFAVRDEVRITVNGKIDKTLIIINEIKEHLKRQDTAIEELNKKIEPIIVIKKTTTYLGKAVMWVGGLIIMVLTVLKLIK